MHPVSMSPSADYASLSIRDAHGKPLDELDGLWYVDKYRFKERQNHIYIAQGQHSVGYQCPGWTSWDDFASVVYRFEAGKSYEVVCEEKGPVINPL